MASRSFFVQQSSSEAESSTASKHRVVRSQDTKENDLPTFHPSEGKLTTLTQEKVLTYLPSRSTALASQGAHDRAADLAPRAAGLAHDRGIDILDLLGSRSGGRNHEERAFWLLPWE